MHRSVSNGTKGPTSPGDANARGFFFFFRCFDISIFQGKFLSVYTPRNLLNETCFIELRSIVRQRGPLKVSNFRLETINMNSVFDLLREMNKGVSL